MSLSPPPPPEEEACKNFNASISPFFSLSMTNVQMKHPPLIPNVFSLYPMEASPFHPFLLLFPPYQMDTNCPHSAGTTFTSCRNNCAKGSNTFSIIVQILLLSNFGQSFTTPEKKHWRIHLPSTHTIARAQALLLSPSPFFARQCGWKRRRSP